MSVGVQIVLFNNGLSEVWRLMRGLSTTIGHARTAEAVGDYRVVVGDSSPTPVLTAEELTDLRNAFEDLDIDYRFFDENLMTANGHNTLAVTHKCDGILVINPDTYPQPNALTELVLAMEDPEVAAAEARQLPLEHPKSFGPDGDTSWASGFCVLYRREAFDLVGGYDSEFFPLYCDDVDISWRMRLEGFRVVHVPAAGVFHDKRLSDAAAVVASPVEEYYGAFSRLMLARRYGRPDIERGTVEHITGHGTPAQRDGVRDFLQRVQAGHVPQALDGADRVAQFVDGEYASSRFNESAS